MVLVIELVIAIVMPLHWRWVRAARRVHDRAHLETRREHAVGIADDYLARHDFFRDDDDTLARERGFLADAEVAPRVRVAVRVGTLHVQDRHIRSQRGDEQRLLTAKRRRGFFETRIRLRQIAAEERVGWNVRRAEPACEQRERNRKVAVIPDFEATRNSLLLRAAIVVSQPRAYVPDPRGDDLLDASRANQLVEEHV